MSAVSPRRGGGSRTVSTIHQQSPIMRNDSHGSRLGVNDSHLTEIQLELELLKERRRALEQQRKLLLRSSGHAAAVDTTAATHSSRSHSVTHASPLPPPFHHHHHAAGHGQSTRSSSARSNRSASRSENSRSASAMDQKQFIPAEKDRREHVAKNIYFEMKEAMRRSWECDSTLVGGFFSQADNPKVGTFGRERRFTPLSGTKGQYYLATDVEEMQRNAKHAKGRHLTASSRGRPGCNVQSNWNDSKGGAAPGPGAYTPRYQKVAKPSILASRMY